MGFGLDNILAASACLASLGKYKAIFKHILLYTICTKPSVANIFQKITSIERGTISLASKMCYVFIY